MSLLLSILLFFITLTTTATEVKLAITVDDIPSSGEDSPHMSKKQIADKIISTLRAAKIPEVYGFVNGKLAANMLEHQEIIKQWKQAGFLIGSHTYSHLDYLNTSAVDFITDVEKNESTLIDFTDSIKEIKVLRLPYMSEGETNDKRYALRSYLAKRSYRTAQVTIDFEDWAWLEPLNRCVKHKNDKKIQELKDRYLSFAKERYQLALKISELIWGNKEIKHILLIHFNSPAATWLGELLNELKQSGAQFISSKEAIFDSLYDEDTTYVGPVGKTFIMQALETRKIYSKDLVVPPSPREWLSQQCQ